MECSVGNMSHVDGGTKDLDSSESFGLGVGFALTPELAQKVRECRGVRRATPVDSSSLIFLKGTKDFNGTTADADASGKATAPPSTEERESTRSTSEEDERRGSGPEGDGMALGSEDVIQVSRTQAGDDAKAGHQASGAAGTRMGDAGGSGDTPDDWEELDDDDTCSLQEPSASRAPSYSDARIMPSGREPKSAPRTEGILEVKSGEVEKLQEGVAPASDGDGESARQRDKAMAKKVERATNGDSSRLKPLQANNEHESSSSTHKRAHLEAIRVASLRRERNAVDATFSRRRLYELRRSGIGDIGTVVSGGGDNDCAQGDEHIKKSLPVLLVDLARICGFRVRGVEEAAVVGGKIRAVLHESFRERSEELFEAGSAVHADSTNLEEELRRRREASTCKSPWAVVDYPNRIGGVSTEEAWEIVVTPSACPAVEVVRRALVATNRNLIWKRDMLEQLESVAVREREAKEAREAEERAEALEAWRARRREQLEKLIEVRPVFERRRAMAEEKLILASANVAAGAEGDAPGDDEAADPVSAAVVRSLDAKLESIDDLIARLEIEEGEDGNGFIPSEDEGDELEEEGDFEDGYDSGYQHNLSDHKRVDGVARASLEDLHRDAGMGAVDADIASTSRGACDEIPTAANGVGGAVLGGETEGLTSIGPVMIKKVRRKKKKRIVQQLRDSQSQQDEARNQQVQEEDASGSCPNSGGVDGGGEEGREIQAPSGRTCRVTENREGKRGTANGSEGNDEEEATFGGDMNVQGSLEKKGEDEAGGQASPPMTLMDAVAAMILGRYPTDPSASEQQHCERMAAMHQQMKDAWRQEFGRLPPMPGSASNA